MVEIKFEQNFGIYFLKILTISHLSRDIFKKVDCSTSDLILRKFTFTPINQRKEELHQINSLNEI